jgi:hypothetical protein
VLAEHVPDLGRRAVLVVREGLDEYCDPGGTVAFVDGGLEVATFAAAERTLDGAIDVVHRNVVRLGCAEGVLEVQIDRRVSATALADSGLDGTDVLADDLAALLVVGSLFPLDLRPLVVPCQG